MGNNKIICKNCGEELLKEDKFCTNCGNSLSSEKEMNLKNLDSNNNALNNKDTFFATEKMKRILINCLYGNSFYKSIIRKDIKSNFRENNRKIINSMIGNDCFLEDIRDTFFGLVNVHSSLSMEKLEPFYNEVNNEINSIYGIKYVERLSYFEEYIRKGANCNVLKIREYQRDIKDNKKVKYAVLFGVYGLGVENQVKDVEIGFAPAKLPSKIKIVPNGIIIQSTNKNDKRVPFSKVIKSENIFQSIHIKLINGENIFLSDCELCNEISLLINKYATGKDEEGWE